MQNTTTIIIIVLVVVLALFLLGGFGMMGFGGRGMMGNMMGGYGTYGFGYDPLGAVLSLVSWALIIGGIVLLVVWLVRNAGKAPGASSESAVDVLKVRYARGEITKKQYDDIKRDLEA